jgi:hypothetical protein
MGCLDVLFAYIGPEVALPMASMLAGMIGFILMVGRAPFRYAAKGLRRAARGVRTPPVGDRSPSDSTPEAP